MVLETSFGSWIKRRRKALDLTQSELAQRVGCSMSAIFKIEADERRPSRQVAELLATHLEIPPEQQALFLKVARQEKVVDSLEGVSPLPYTPPVLADAPQRSNLPIFPTLFIGREPEIHIVLNLLQDPACRLLTLTGLGGVGKTRLAVEVARKLEPVFPDGIFFLPMGAVNLPESIVPVLADSLGIVFSGPADPKLQIINTLRNKKVLLIFDNMEHLVSGSSILAELLQQAPNVKLLLTSREQVHLQWEWVFDVQGLPAPEETTPKVLETNSAITLFLQRARQASQSFSLEEDEVPALVRICRSVDGLPLAIELAASWVRVMSLREIAVELERNLDLLATSLYDVPARHRSMKAVFDHSWALLTEDERAVMVKLAAFSGGFTRQAANAVAGASLPLLSSLVSKSFLRYNTKTDRYDFHELIRQYAYDQLLAHPDAEEPILAKHGQYFSGWLAEIEAPLKSEEQVQISSLMRTETANCISAWRWSVQNRRYDLLRQMAPCLYWFYEIHGNYSEALSTYQFAVDELRASGAPGILSNQEELSAFTFLVDQLGWFKFRTGDVEQAVALFTESAELAGDTADQLVLYYNHVNWGYLALVNGDNAEAKRLTLKSLENAQALGYPWSIAISENILGIVEFQQGNLEGAYRQLSDSLKVWRSIQDLRGLTFCMLYLSATALALGKIETAEAILQESNAIAQGKMDRWSQAFGLDLLGQAAMLKEEYEKAHDLFKQSLTLSKAIGDNWAGTNTLIHLGEAQVSLGAYEEARRLFREAFATAQQAKWAPTILEALVALISIDEEMAAETRLAITLAVLLQAGATHQVRQRAERLRDRLIESLPKQQAEMAQIQAADMKAEMWEPAILRTG